MSMYSTDIDSAPKRPPASEDHFGYCSPVVPHFGPLPDRPTGDLYGRAIYRHEEEAEVTSTLTAPRNSQISDQPLPVRDAQASEIDALARIWHDGWHAAHARILPAKLSRYRTVTSFKHRLQAALSSVRVAGSLSLPVGFSMTKGHELHQLYVSKSGNGLGSALLRDAECQMMASGMDTAWLACAIGNERAAMFYRRHGWHFTGVMTYRVDAPDGGLSLDVWRFSKDLLLSRLLQSIT